MKPSIKIALGIFTALSVMAFIVIWDFVWKDSIDSVEVVVVKPGETIELKEAVSTDKVAIERRQKKDLVGDVVYASDLESIIGVDAAQLIVSNSMISSQMLDFDNLIPDPNKGEAIRPIPAEWIYAAPGSLRRKDRVDIYLLDESLISKVQGKEQKNSDETIKVVSNEEETIKHLKLKPLLEDVAVIYVKDGSNREVINQDEKQGSNNNQQRLNATGRVSDLEILLNEEDFNKIADAVLGKHGRLYITYR
ncbi:hypothetical protein [Sutcliffiella cohnii]|uniref:hypothetical protein n=1 Tax=Sutcliffiella cohnii TaxID=33932 RepID=UPI000833C64E|nr:hypothetical protein [Sutcliffiella cohnii]